MLKKSMLPTVDGMVSSLFSPAAEKGFRHFKP